MSSKTLAVALTVAVAILAVVIISDPWLLWSLSYKAHKLLAVVGVVAVCAFVIRFIVKK